MATDWDGIPTEFLSTYAIIDDPGGLVVGRSPIGWGQLGDGTETSEVRFVDPATITEVAAHTIGKDRLSSYIVGLKGVAKDTPPGYVTAKLYFADCEATGAGQNVMDISLGGQSVETGFDAYALAGGSHEVQVTVSPYYHGGGPLKWLLTPTAGHTFLNDATAVAATPLPVPPTPGPIPPPPTGSNFRIVGTQIVDPSNVVFIPNGVNLGGSHAGGSANAATTAGSQAYFPAWGFNTARINHYPFGSGNDQNDDIDAIIHGFTDNGYVAMIDLHADAGGDTVGRYLLGNLVADGDWWAAFATTYIDNPYVWFNLRNEPGPTEDPVNPLWLSEYEYLIQRIRATGNNNIIVLDDAMFGQGGGWDALDDGSRSGIVTYGSQLVSRYANLLFSIHGYDQWAQNEPTKLTAFIDQVHGSGLALVIGETAEFGDPTVGNAGRPQFDACYDVAPGRGVGIIQWHGQSTGGGWYALLTDSRYLGDINDPIHPTNLTYAGARAWALAHP